MKQKKKKKTSKRGFGALKTIISLGSQEKAKNLRMNKFLNPFGPSKV